MTYDQTLQQVAGDKQTVESLEPVVKATLDKYIGLLRAKRDEFLALAAQYREIAPSEYIGFRFGYHLGINTILTTPDEAGFGVSAQSFRFPKGIEQRGPANFSFDDTGYYPQCEYDRITRVIYAGIKNFPDGFRAKRPMQCNYEAEANVWSKGNDSCSVDLKFGTSDQAIESIFSSTGSHLADAGFLSGVIRWDLSEAGVYMPLAFLPLATIAAANRFLKDQVDNAHGRAAGLDYVLDDLANI